jgi:DHA1 family inner membrane transport protein
VEGHGRTQSARRALRPAIKFPNLPFLVVVCTSVFASAISWRSVDPMLPVIATDLGVSLSDAVLLSSAFSFPLAIMQVVFGPVGDAWGKVRVVRVGLAVVALSLVLMAMAPGFLTLLLARILGGAFTGGVNPVMLALVGERIAYEHRQVALGKFLVAMIGGQMVGAAAAGLLVDFIGWRAVFGYAAIVVAAASLLAWFGLDATVEPRRKLSFSGSLRNYQGILSDPRAQMVLLTIMLEGILVLSLIPFVAGMVMLHGATGSGATAAGIVIAGFAVGGVAFGFLVRRILAALGQWNMIRMGGALAGGALLLTAAPVHWGVIAGLFFVVGFAFYMFHNTIQVYVTELAPHARGAGVSMGAFFFMTGQGLGPVIWGVVARFTGFGLLFALAGALTIVLGLVSATLLEKRFARAAAGS